MSEAFSLLSSQLPELVRLTDGTLLIFREISPADAPRLLRLHKRLSGETLYRRFMVAAPKPTPEAIEHLTNLDHADREAIVATYRGEVIAVARYHHSAGASSNEAEIAVVVEDRWQHRGIARALFTRLAQLAQQRGIEAFVGTMLADNVAATRLLLAMNPHSQRTIEQGELSFRIPLKDAP
ncbi:MAG: hypothetical protein NVSMB57_13850 [Actinomycetota bacterium]